MRSCRELSRPATRCAWTEASFTARPFDRESLFACTFLLAPALRSPLRSRCTHCLGVLALDLTCRRSTLLVPRSASLGDVSIQGRYHPAGAPMPTSSHDCEGLPTVSIRWSPSSILLFLFSRTEAKRTKNVCVLSREKPHRSARF